ncbi:hypothetical protein AMAG_04511 [Allomyces macrogynus ATCC 38327]|uniref:Uncharacterized protein n=1 Tax=Allomyces macrogynus (strain ATCC 38327) TaxID=578462 RepID=A0A0L0S5F3_ALLM3|nr:hypothetical protein AMAG_04511 [Allomyces macrogynus ATCC 38327]|eukprot:KNE57646.1 hypothetical protein AMAG_04511 [Allomyces macrogynus ATCC 38327]
MDLDPTPTSPLDPVHDLAAVDDGSPGALMDVDVPVEGEETIPDVAHGLAAWSLWKQLLRNDVGQRTSTDMALRLVLGPQPGILWPSAVHPRDAQIGGPKVSKSHPQRFLPIPTKFMDDSGLLSDLDGDENSGSDSDGVKGEESDDDVDDVEHNAAAEDGARSPSADQHVLDEREKQWERDLAPFRTRATSSSTAPAVPFDFLLSSSGSDSDDADDLALPAGVRRSAPGPSTDPIAAHFPAHRVHPSAPARGNPRTGLRSGLHNQMTRQAAMSIHETEGIEYDGDFVDMLTSHVADSTMDQVDALLRGIADAVGKATERTTLSWTDVISTALEQGLFSKDVIDDVAAIMSSIPPPQPVVGHLLPRRRKLLARACAILADLVDEINWTDTANDAQLFDAIQHRMRYIDTPPRPAITPAELARFTTSKRTRDLVPPALHTHPRLLDLINRITTAGRVEFFPAMNPFDYLPHWLWSCIPPEPATTKEDAAIMRELEETDSKQGVPRRWTVVKNLVRDPDAWYRRCYRDTCRECAVREDGTTCDACALAEDDGEEEEGSRVVSERNEERRDTVEDDGQDVLIESHERSQKRRRY